VRKAALTVAVLGFFALAFVGWAHGAAPLDCGLRALLGATVLYVLVRVGERLVFSIMIDAIVRSVANGRHGAGGGATGGGATGGAAAEGPQGPAAPPGEGSSGE
jgi:uncharacterized membrane protein YgcG